MFKWNKSTLAFSTGSAVILSISLKHLSSINSGFSGLASSDTQRRSSKSLWTYIYKKLYIVHGPQYIYTQQQFSGWLIYTSPVPTSATDWICHFCEQQQAIQIQLQIFLFYFQTQSPLINQMICTNWIKGICTRKYCVIIKSNFCSSITIVWSQSTAFQTVAPPLCRQ